MISIFVLTVALLQPATAKPFPCWMVRKAVAQYGEAAVESWARAKGISEKEIEKAKRCLN